MNNADKFVVKFLNKVFNYLIAFGLITFGLFFYLKDKGYFKKRDQALQVSHASSLDTERIVNQYLQETNRKMQRDQVDSKKAIEDALREANKLKIKPEPTPMIPRDAQIAKDPANDPNYHLIKRSAVAESLKKQMQNQSQGLDKEEYARQFIENARRGGYHIELSDELEVIRVTPIRQPSQEIDMVEILPSN